MASWSCWTWSTIISDRPGTSCPSTPAISSMKALRRRGVTRSTCARRAPKPVREFIVQNALYWLHEFRFDGLRLDAVHALVDDGDPHVLREFAARVRESAPDREIHLARGERAQRRRVARARRRGRATLYTAQWNDDVHHCWHVLLTGETDSYYAAYGDDPASLLAKCLVSGFAFQGEAYGPRGGLPRGSPSMHLPPAAFINFIQNPRSGRQPRPRRALDGAGRSRPARDRDRLPPPVAASAYAFPGRGPRRDQPLPFLLRL